MFIDLNQLMIKFNLRPKVCFFLENVSNMIASTNHTFTYISHHKTLDHLRHSRPSHIHIL